MRMRIISAAAVLGLGIVGITLAQQTGDQPKERAGDKAKLRAQVVKLRVEIELLELDHDADRASLLEEMRDERQKQRQDEANLLNLNLVKVYDPKAPTPMNPPKAMKPPRSMKDWEEIEGRVRSGDRTAVALLTYVGEALAGLTEDELVAMADEDELIWCEVIARQFLAKWARANESPGARVGRKKKDFARQAAQLAEKRLELAEVERWYTEAK